jgi:uncharacterized membrane protein
MQKQQGLHSNAEVAGATQLCRSSRRYTVKQKQQALHGKEEAAGAKL